MKCRPQPALALALMLSLLAACDTAQERAERHFQSGLEYLQDGDVDRALVEFRNVFELNGEHHDARLAYADAERARGNTREAYSQYLRLIEQYPNDPAGLKALADLAAEAGQWDDATQFVTQALKGAPDDGALQAIRLFTEYGRAVEDDDTGKIISTVKEAGALAKKLPDSLLLRKVIIDDLVRAGNLSEALTELDAAIRIAPREKLLYAQRLSVNAALKDDVAVETGLKEMVGLFPDAPEMAEALQRWYLSRKEYDKAEALLRSRVDPASDATAPIVDLVRFLGQFRGPEAALKELDAAIAAGKSVSVLRSARAGFHFDQGDHAGAIAEMEEIVGTVTDADEGRAIKVALARMYLADKNDQAARRLVGQVLSEDSGNAEAIKLKAGWLIQDDQADDAIAVLRSAIDQNPQDAGLMTLMAQAYERQGDRDLMRDMLSQAVRASGRAPAESLRYARLLASEDKLVPAESVVIDALRIAPGEPGLLVALGSIYVALQDWGRAGAVADELEGLKDPAVEPNVASMRAAILDGQQKTGDALTYLQRLASAEGAKLDAKVAVLRNHLANGRNAEAVAYAAKLLAEEPGNRDLVFINATVQAITGDLKNAETGFRAVLAAEPGRADVWLALYRALKGDPSRAADAAKVLEEGLAAVPQSPELRWAKAGVLESADDIEGAIAIYEELYKQNSANPVVANNLASLLSNYRTDADSLKRAEVIARRLRGSSVPAYQDTFGWIAYQNGSFDLAVKELARAAVGLPQDPTVQYHLAMAYLATKKPAEAAKKFAEALALIPANDSRAFAISARSELDKLKAAGIAPESP